jgi:multidrug efflux system membrane fusion protein
MDQAPSVSHHAAGSTFSEPAKKRRHRWIWVVVLLLFGLLFYWVLHQRSVSQEQGGFGGPGGGGQGGGRNAGAGGQGGGGGRGNRFGGGGGAIPVSFATATEGDLGVYLNAIGTVTPVYTYTITSQVTGVIAAVHFREGQSVKKGDPLIDIDPRQYAAQLAQAEGVLARDQSILAKDKMDLERYQDAWKKNAIPRQTLEDQEKQVTTDEGTVKNDQATVDYDKVFVTYTHIVSPIDGRVGLRLVDPGNLVTANSSTALGVVTQIQPITVIFTVAQDNLPQVLEQMRAGRQLEVDAFDRNQQNLLSKGRLITVDNQIDTTTGTVKLRAEFPNANGTLFPNQFVNTRLLVKTLKKQLLLPSSAIQHNGDQSFVYMIDNDKAVMRTVTTGMSEGGNTVVAGLNPGDNVANSSFEKLQNGSTVYKSRFELPGTTTGDTTGNQNAGPSQANGSQDSTGGRGNRNRNQ